ncbi:MAG TPA: cell wall-binding repeat-containing protein [Candidatus Limnocylindrales bacterium]|nr:cell wall-binding repeat-containing protein [Candidatus Limnocylindrales bacterium]
MIRTTLRPPRFGRLLSLLLAIGVAVAALPLASPTAAANGITLLRYAGSDRYATAAAISAASFEPGVSTAYIATGRDFPDALAGAAAAAADDAPTLLVTATTIPDATRQELGRLKPGRIVILGGPSVVSTSVGNALSAYTTGKVVRIAGSDRYATAAAISRATFPAGVPVAYVATGTKFPDALGGAAAAGRQGAPVLLVSDHVPEAVATELRRLAPASIIILGGRGVVSAAVEEALGAFTGGPVTRIAGVDRYDTSVAISRSTYESASVVYLATGINFPDALAGAPLRGPLLLTPGDYLLPAVRTEIARLGATTVIVLGSTGAIRASTAHDAAGLPYTDPSGRWIGNLYDGRAVRYQQPDPYACTATAVLMMLNMAAYAGIAEPEGFMWTPTIAFDVQSAILAWERDHMTQPQAGTDGSDPHGWRNALNHFGWGSLEADVYRDLAFDGFDAALRQAIVSAASLGKPSGLLMLNGAHAVVLHGWDVTGDDPRTGSTNFTVGGVYITDPWGPVAHRNFYISRASLAGGTKWVQFGRFTEPDSTIVDPIDGRIGRDEWQGRYVIVAAVR